MVVNNCLKDLEGGMGLKRMFKLVPQVGKKGAKTVILDFGSFTRRGLFVDCVCSAEAGGRHKA